MAELVNADAAAALASGSIPKIRKALAELPAAVDRRPFQLSIVRTFTIETQTAAIELAFALQTGRCATIAVADLGAIEAELFDAESSIISSGPDAILALWRLEELHPDLIANAAQFTAERRRSEVDAVAERLRALVTGYNRVAHAPLFLSTFVAPHARLSDRTDAYGIAWATAHLNALLFELAASFPNIYVFDVAAWQQTTGQAASDEKMDLFARQPIARGALGSFADAVARTLAPLVCPPAKVLAIDLDNVLWGGVLGEEGFAGVAVGHDFPGNVHRRIQTFVRALRDSGVLLALVSKNDLPLVQEAFERRTDMVLSLADFSAMRINWLPKHENLASIAAELNLGLDSFVFVDDQEFEQETVRFHLPEVRVLDCGSDALSILQALRSSTAFDSLRVGEADRNRNSDYTAQKERHVAQTGADLGDFLRTLDLRIDLAPVDASSIGRAHQMLHKTNQFNVTTKRHSQAQLDDLIRNGAIALTLSMRDRFGDQGIVGLAIATRSNELAEIDTFLMSCRALGRGAEQTLWAGILARLNTEGVTTLRATFDPTEKNAQVSDLFDRFGMTRESEVDGKRHYSARLPLDAHVPIWVNLDSAALR